MNILIIGNGFDLAHGLSTTYGDFLHYIKEFQRFQEIVIPDNYADEILFPTFIELRDSHPSYYDELVSLVYDNSWLSLFEKIWKDRESNGKTGWIDFESEISQVIQSLDSVRLDLLNHMQKGKTTIQTNLYDRQKLACVMSPRDLLAMNQDLFRSYKEKLLTDLNRLTRCLEIYLTNYAEKVKCEKLTDIAGLEIDKVLSFNYTNTYSRLYGNSSSTIEYDYIHGQASIDSSTDTCNLVLGIDEYLNGDSRNIDNEFIAFKKFYQRIYKGTGCHYTDWLDEHKKLYKKGCHSYGKNSMVYIYGHSLDITDKDVLRRIILSDGIITTIFYHNKEALGKYIANLVKIIGEEELIKMTDGSNKRIVFKLQSNEKTSKHLPQT